MKQQPLPDLILRHMQVIRNLFLLYCFTELHTCFNSTIFARLQSLLLQYSQDVKNKYKYDIGYIYFQRRVEATSVFPNDG